MSNQTKQQLIVWWVLWGAFQVGIFFIYNLLGGAGAPSRTVTDGSPVWLAALAPLVLSAMVRWLVLPRVRQPRTALSLSIVGIAMAEATCLMGLFIFPAHKRELFFLSALGIFQFIPFYARRYFAQDDLTRAV
jgi:hypothetical protein